MLCLSDTHCHLDFDVFDAEREVIIKQCQLRGIRRIIVPSTTVLQWSKTLSVCAQYPMLIPALGLHPQFASQHQTQDLQALATHCQQAGQPGGMQLLGEIGLDFYDRKLSEKQREQQIYFFTGQLKLARQYQFPVSIHARKAHYQIIALLKQYTPQRGFIHAFNGSMEEAKEYIKLGFKLGFGGAFCHPKAQKLRQLTTALPLSALVLETDAPDMLPWFARGEEKNSPLFINEIFGHLCANRREPVPQIARTLEENVNQILSYSASYTADRR